VCYIGEYNLLLETDKHKINSLLKDMLYKSGLMNFSDIHLIKKLPEVLKQSKGSILLHLLSKSFKNQSMNEKFLHILKDSNMESLYYKIKFIG